MFGNREHAHERIVGALLAKSALRPVPRYEKDVVTQREELVLNALDERLVVSARKVSASDRTGKEHVAYQRQPIFRLKEDQMAGGMAGQVDHLKAAMTAWVSSSHSSGVNATVGGKPK